MVPKAALEKTEEGLVPAGEGWFVVLNAREARRRHREGRGDSLGFFLVLSGEALLVIEGEERSLRQWTSCTARPDWRRVASGSLCGLAKPGTRLGYGGLESAPG